MSVVAAQDRAVRQVHPELIAAMRATVIPAPQERGLWYIQRIDLGVRPDDSPFTRASKAHAWQTGAFHEYPDMPPVMTSLHRWTDETMHRGHGETVMSDDPRELRKHLPIVLTARGRVLVTGLGLGCVVRGLLARPAVERVDVVEIDRDVLDMVAAGFDGEPRLVIHHADALTIDWPAATHFDYAWHDVWGDEDGTQVLHARLLKRYRPMVRYQGAWEFPRQFKRCWPFPLIGGGRQPPAGGR